MKTMVRCAWAVGWVAVVAGLAARADEPPALNPFGASPTQERDDSVPGYVELSDGTISPGKVYLTRDARLKIHDASFKRQREVPLRAVRQIECAVKREWMEREWRFKETAADEKVYTGKSYPAREYAHTITLRDGRTITGPLAAIVYVEPDGADASASAGGAGGAGEAQRFFLRKRDKGEVGTDLKSLVYVKRVKLGEEVMVEGREKMKGAADKKDDGN